MNFRVGCARPQKKLNIVRIIIGPIVDEIVRVSGDPFKDVRS